MSLVVAIFCVLVPAPRPEPPPRPHPIVGAWTIEWGESSQTTFFRADGCCWSPAFGAGQWREENEYIWFSEHGGTMRYVMCVDLAEGSGAGWHMSADGEVVYAVRVRLRRGERLPPPRLVD